MDFTFLAETYSLMKLLFMIFSVISILYEVRDIKTLFHFSQSFLPSVFFPFLIFCEVFPVQFASSEKLSVTATNWAHNTIIQFLLLQISDLYFPSSQNFKSSVDSVHLHAGSSHKYLLLRIPFLWEMTLHQCVLDPDVLRHYIVVGFRGWNVLVCLVSCFHSSSHSLRTVKSEGIRCVGHVAYMGLW